MGPKSAGFGVVAACLVAVSLTGCRFTAVKDEPVSLAAVANAVVVSGGSERAAVDGAHLRKGDRVRTLRGGTATLVVRGRRVVLGGATEVGVPDGATVELAKGSLLLDRRHGPGLTLRAGDTSVDELGTGAVRVERSFSVVVAALSTHARVSTATGSRLALRTLYQVNVAGRALPRQDSPLHLRDDAWERGVIGDVVADDVRLNRLAEGLDSQGTQADVVLPEAIGHAAGSDDTSRRKLATEARSLRAGGGSWGVVARLVRTTALEVGTALSDVLREGTPSPAPSETPGSGGTPGPTPTPTTGPTGGPPPTRTPGPTPSSPGPTTDSPSSPPGPVDTIESLLPTLPVLEFPL